MAIIVTAGGATSNSFVDVATADAYHSARLHNDEWGGATTAVKESALQWATRELEKENWAGAKATETQALRWPRSGVYDRDGFLLADTVIPKWLEEATSELALALLREDTTVSNDLSGFSSLSLDGVGSMVLKGTPGKPSIDKSVRSIFSFYTANSGSIVVVRA